MTQHRIARFALFAAGTAAVLTLGAGSRPAAAATPLADQPLFSTSDVPGNLLLALSVEYPTAVSVANLGNYDPAKEYLGYFDPKKCYEYQYDATTPASSYFKPKSTTTDHTCADRWSGNFMNWATMQTIDPYRWALTGGYRAVDTASMTILEKAWASGQGGTGNFPNRGSDQGTNHKLSAAPSTVTPLAWAKFNLRIQGVGNRMVFTGTGNVNTDPATHFQNATATGDAATAYQVHIRVQVCDASGDGSLLESNCVVYPNDGVTKSYKPEGLMQQYAEKIRYSAFGYLNDSNINRDGGVMRARMKFVGPHKPVPGSLPVGNAVAEWSATDGTFLANPDASDATATALTGVNRSGVLNYLNQFGQTSGSYKTYDPVSELYYAGIRYYKKLGNVAEWTDGATAAMADGFPIIKEWDDPILYSCQKNFILGIGDVNTHADGNVAGSSLHGKDPAEPTAVAGDKTVDATKATNKVGELEGLGDLGTTYWTGTSNNPTYYMAGLAYDAHTVDIRPDGDAARGMPGQQTVSTYWLDVLEYQAYKSKNPYWLAAKYGGFNVPTNYDPYAATLGPANALWATTSDLVGTDKRPDNYFTAERADVMVSSLKKAFASIVSQLKAYTTSFATALPNVASSGVASYGAQYDAGTWTGEVVASKLTLSASGVPSQTQAWKFSERLAAQLASTGWDTQRRVATWNAGGVAFRHGNLSTAQKAALATSYAPSNSATDYVNYLRGDRTHEKGSSASGSTKAYRERAGLLGDIVGSKLRPVGTPSQPFSDATNPGYSTFRSTWAARPTVVYFGANDGMLHAVLGDVGGNLAATGAGQELFAYVPSALFAGPTGSAATNGLAALGNPEFSHRYYVNATPAAFDVDLGRTVGGSGTNWRTLLVGGLGKGGRSYYALDVTDPASMAASETALASKVMWEFSDADLGYSFGEPVMVRTRQHGWVVVLTSGYNNDDGVGYFFIVNPRTGALIQKISTGAGSTTTPAGLAHAVGIIPDRASGLADSVYAGDLLGNLWRLDLTAASGTYPLTRIATLTDSSGDALAVTTKPTVGVQAGTDHRFVLVGTGRLLDTSDVSGSQAQSFFAIRDGSAARFNRADDLPTGISFPIPRSRLVVNTDPTAGVTWDASTKMGWVFDLGSSSTGIGWRVITDPTNAAGVVSFASTLPNGDACSPSGRSRIYLIDFGTGKTELLDSSDAPLASIELNNAVSDVRMTRSPAGKIENLYGDNTGALDRSNRRHAANAATLRRINWRELPLAD